MLMKFCQQRATTVLSSRDADIFQNWLLDLLAARVPPLKHLARALEASAAQVDATALNMWRRGVKVPPPREGSWHWSLSSVATASRPATSARNCRTEIAERRRGPLPASAVRSVGASPGTCRMILIGAR
ncbi:hypothetical protein [Ancylobacter amanitiformis]|uniref:Uncharacterized protein n=1 Tax=Ancylobacter amanitiformis TaxID=217069 RepID=A0ABU0LVJ7_9HYPH|nr:hypothetical protein [Ancylobacter amanitiformis]